MKGNKQGLFSPGGRTLQILSATEEDAGRYTCVAANEAGETLKNYAVKVFGELLHRHTQPATHVWYLWFVWKTSVELHGAALGSHGTKIYPDV